MKKYLLILSSLFLFLFFKTNVYAEINYDYEFKIINRYYEQLPFETWYDAGENTSYTGNSVKIFGTNSQLNNPPRYLYLIYCATGSLDFGTTSVTAGDISNNGSTVGSTCSVQGYTGNYYLNRWTVKEWSDASDSNIYRWIVTWNLSVYNSLSYPVYIDVQSFFLSNELIQDFSSDYLLSEILSQNASLKSSLNDLQSSTDDTNNKLDKTNEELSDINDNITNDNVSGVEDSFSKFDDYLDDNSTITQLITLPITLYSAILNNVNGTCQPFNFGALYGENLVLPCINIGNYLGSTLWSMIDLIISGFAIYSISKKLIKVFNNFSSLKEGDVIDD